MAEGKKEGDINKLHGDLIARAHECSKEVKRLINRLPTAIDDERSIHEEEMQGLAEQLAAAKAELEKVKGEQKAVGDGEDALKRELKADKEARTSAEAKVQRLKMELEAKVGATDGGTEGARVKTEVAALRAELKRLRPKAPPTAPAAMREDKGTTETVKDDTKPVQRNIDRTVERKAEHKVERKVEYPVRVAKDRRAQSHGGKHERSPDLLDDLAEAAGLTPKLKRQKAEAAPKFARVVPVCMACHHGGLECDGKAQCKHCRVGLCLYNMCKHGSACRNKRCSHLHPEQRRAEDGDRVSRA